jgi:OmpA-OmpF porin, OOP family
MTSRSADGRPGRAAAAGRRLTLTAAVLALLLGGAGPGRAQQTSTTASTRPPLTVPPVVDPAAVTNPDAPALDIDAPALDILAPASSLDESESEVQIGNQQQITLAADVLFAFDRATLTGAARSRLARVAAALRQHPGSDVRIDGYTDAKGSPVYNLKLSVRRAKAVEAALAKLLPGVSIRFVSVGHGEANPVAANTKPDHSDNPAGRAKNRRVTITFPR